MSGNRKLHKLIQNADKDSRNAVLENIHEDIDCAYLATRQTKSMRSFKKRNIFYIVASVLASAIAVVLCLVLIPPSSSNDRSRYCTHDDYEVSISALTVAEYNTANNTVFLYFDWYDNAELIIDTVYTDKQDGTLLCFSEELINGNTGQRTIISVTKLNIYIDVLDNFKSMCEREYNEGQNSFLWTAVFDKYYCVFEYNNNRYYLEISDISNVNELAGVVDSLIVL